MKLTKTKDAQWNGNGFGTSSAQYSVAGMEHIIIYNKGNGYPDWAAIDANTGKHLIRPFGWKRSEVLSQLAPLLVNH